MDLNNTLGFPILTWSIFLPTAGAVFIWLFVRGEMAVRLVALGVSVVTFLLTLPLWAYFDNATAHMQFEEFHPWISAFNVNYRLGVDGISMPFILLTSLLTVVCIVSAWECIKTRVKEYMIAFLVLETTLIGVFAALDGILFYFFWEAMLIPMFLIIGVWGGANRVYATIKFFLYTLAGSVLMLIALLAMYFKAGHTFDIQALMDYPFDFQWQFWIWIGFFPLMVVLSLIAVIYISLVAMMQQDMKRLIAYSSIAHMGFVTLGTFMFTQQSLEGAIFGMISHGFVAAALFLCVGVLYDRMHTREIADYGGVANVMPVFAAVMMLFCMANVALPGASAFIAEIMVLIGTFSADQLYSFVISTKWVAVLAASSVVLSAAYTLWMYKRVIMGDLVKDEVKAMPDMNVRELAFFAPLMVLVLWLGLYPVPVLDVLHSSVSHLIVQATTSKLEAAHALAHAQNIQQILVP